MGSEMCIRDRDPFSGFGAYGCFTIRYVEMPTRTAFQNNDCLSSSRLEYDTHKELRPYWYRMSLVVHYYIDNGVQLTLFLFFKISNQGTSSFPK